MSLDPSLSLIHICCVLHCFGEDRATMERFVELGCYIAYGGAATFKRNDDVREAFEMCIRDRTFTCTITVTSMRSISRAPAG